MLPYLLNASDDAQAQQQRTHVSNKLFAAAGEIYSRGAARPRRADVDATIRRPQMPEQQSYLCIAQLEYRGRQMLLVRTLIVYSETLQPCTNAGGMPAIAIARNDELMPVASARVPSHRAAESHRALGHQFAVCLRS